MLKLSKRYTLEIRQEVLVYFKIHKRVFSMKDVKTGHVISLGNDLIIESS